MWKSTLRSLINTAAIGLAVGLAAWILVNTLSREEAADAASDMAITAYSHSGGALDHDEPARSEDACCPASKPASEPLKETMPAASGELHSELWCSEHDLPEAACGACNPARTAALRPGESLMLRLPSKAAAEKAGVELGTPGVGSAEFMSAFPCNVSYDQNQLLHIAPLVSGVLEEIHVNLGQTISEGEIVAVLSSPELAELRSAYASALAELDLANAVYEREKGLRDKGITSVREFEEAIARRRQVQTLADNLRQRLTGLGVREADLRTSNPASVPRVLLRAAIGGTVVERHAVRGEAVDRGTPIMTLANLDEMWLELSAPVSQLELLRAGTRVAARFDAFKDRDFEGIIDWIDSRIDEQNRTVRARAVLNNSDGLLKDGMFGEAHVAGQDAGDGLLVPAESVHTYDGNPFLFVYRADDLYEVRRVALGGRAGQQVEIREGLLSSERIATARSFIVKSEFLKARLGAGCTDD